MLNMDEQFKSPGFGIAEHFGALSFKLHTLRCEWGPKELLRISTTSTVHETLV